MRKDIYQAIADPTRRAIIVLIALQALTPNSIAENFNTTRQAIFKHLRILVECDCVKDNWLAQFRQIWESRFNQLDEVLAALKIQK
jgi:DNA-binding transcriptional ArsR family regulator